MVAHRIATLGLTLHACTRTVFKRCGACKLQWDSQRCYSDDMGLD